MAQHGVQVGSWSREQLPGQTGYKLQHHNTAVAASYSVEQQHHTTAVVVTSLGWRERGMVGVTSAGAYFQFSFQCLDVQYVNHVRDDKI